MKPIHAALCTEHDEIWLIGLYEEYQDAFDAIIEDFKETINYHMEDNNYSDKKLTDDMFIPGMEPNNEGTGYPNFYVRVSKDGISVHLLMSDTSIQWRIRQTDKVNTHQDVLDSMKKEEQK